MAEPWTGIVNTTAPKYLKGADDLTIREWLLLKMIERRGGILLNQDSYQLNWDVEYRQPPVEAYADGGTLDFTRHDVYRKANLDWRGYVATDLMTEKERLMNRGTTAIVRRYERIMPNLVKSMRTKFGTEIFLDGYAAGNENRMCGVESFCGEGTCASTDRIMQPSDTYAGLQTQPGLDGTWSANLTTKPNATIATDWPDGNGDSEYDYWTPKLVNWSCSNWDTSSATTWLANCIHVLRKTIQWMSLTVGTPGRSLMGLMSGELFYGFKNAQDSARQIVVPHRESEDLGFPDVLNFEGMGLKAEYGMEANTAYCFNLAEMKLMSLNDGLFARKGPEWDPKQFGYLFAVGFFGNLKFNSPKYFAKLHNYA